MVALYPSTEIAIATNGENSIAINKGGRSDGVTIPSEVAKDPNPTLRKRVVSGSFLSAFGQVTLFAALSFAPTIYVVPTYNLKSLVTVLLAYAVIPKSEGINKRAILGAVLAIGGIVLINL